MKINNKFILLSVLSFFSACFSSEIGFSDFTQEDFDEIWNSISAQEQQQLMDSGNLLQNLSFEELVQKTAQEIGSGISPEYLQQLGMLILVENAEDLKTFTSLEERSKFDNFLQSFQYFSGSGQEDSSESLGKGRTDLLSYPLGAMHEFSQGVVSNILHVEKLKKSLNRQPSTDWPTSFAKNIFLVGRSASGALLYQQNYSSQVKTFYKKVRNSFNELIDKNILQAGVEKFIKFDHEKEFKDQFNSLNPLVRAAKSQYYINKFYSRAKLVAFFRLHPNFLQSISLFKQEKLSVDQIAELFSSFGYSVSGSVWLSAFLYNFSCTQLTILLESIAGGSIFSRLQQAATHEFLQEYVDKKKLSKQLIYRLFVEKCFFGTVLPYLAFHDQEAFCVSGVDDVLKKNMSFTIIDTLGLGTSVASLDLLAKAASRFLNVSNDRALDLLSDYSLGLIDLPTFLEAVNVFNIGYNYQQYFGQSNLETKKLLCANSDLLSGSNFFGIAKNVVIDLSENQNHKINLRSLNEYSRVAGCSTVVNAVLSKLLYATVRKCGPTYAKVYKNVLKKVLSAALKTNAISKSTADMLFEVFINLPKRMAKENYLPNKGLSLKQLGSYAGNNVSSNIVQMSLLNCLPMASLHRKLDHKDFLSIATNLFVKSSYGNSISNSVTKILSKHLFGIADFPQRIKSASSTDSLFWKLLSGCFVGTAAATSSLAFYLYCSYSYYFDLMAKIDKITACSKLTKAQKSRLINKYSKELQFELA